MKRKSTGFALIEVIVAIVVLAGALAGATSLMMTAGNAVSTNQSRLTATYLAQECLELARNTRDTAWMQRLPWNCAFQETTINECQELKSTILPMLDGEHLVEVLGEPTKFSRKMNVTIDEDDEELMAVECAVSWPKRSGTESVKISELLSNWRKS